MIGVGNSLWNRFLCGGVCDPSYTVWTDADVPAVASVNDAYAVELGMIGVGNSLWNRFLCGGVCDPSYTVWTDADVPAVASANDAYAVELGVKFRSAIDGFITGIRFYKGDLNTGTHVGNLWTATGTRLATATFTNETATGWQQVNFSAPVPITANTTYVASYHAPNGGYAFNASFFTTAVDKPPLRLLSDADAGGNGVYRYGPSGFPNQSWNASNYWVDVIFRAA